MTVVNGSTLNEANVQNGMVANSEISHSWAPQEGDGPNLDALAADAIKDIEAEFNPAPEFDDAPDGETPVEGDAPPEVKAEVPTEDEADDDYDPKQMRMFERVAQRELAASEREKAAVAAEARVKALTDELKSLQGLKSTKELSDMFDLDPVGAFKALGKDPDVMIKLALGQTIPADKLPESLREFNKSYATQREIAQLRAQVAHQEQSRKAQEYVNTVTTGAREYLTKSVGDSTPTLAVVMKANPERALREIMEEISLDARTRAASDPNGEHLAFSEAAARVEKRMSEWKSMFEVKNGEQATTQAKKPTGQLPPQSKPPQKPLRPWEKRDDDLYESGIADAVREFHRAEAAAKVRR